MSIAPPKLWQLKVASAIIFVFLFGAGFLITNEQASRSAASANDQARLIEKDNEAKKQYDKDLISLNGQITGMSNAIAAVAKGSPNPDWSALLSKLPKPSIVPQRCVEDDTHRFACTSNRDLGVFSADEATRALREVASFRQLTDQDMKDGTYAGTQLIRTFRFTRVMEPLLPDMRALELADLTRLGPSYSNPEFWVEVQPSDRTRRISPILVEDYGFYLRSLGARVGSLP